MITKDYIENFIRTESFETISRGLLKGDLSAVVLGKGKYKLTSQYENSPTGTVPSQVIVAAHILTSKGELESDCFIRFFNDTIIEEENICLIIEYCLLLKKYYLEHSEIKRVDLKSLIKSIEEKDWLENINCLPLLTTLREEFQ